jgi:hypothetical protein
MVISCGWVRKVNGGYIKIEFEMYDLSLTHKEQGMIEIYNRTSFEKEEVLTEMEYHGPYGSILPSESKGVSERWKIIKYEGDEEGRKNFLDNI